ncbi:MAG TPA: hypothetical protein VEF04_04840 [Blastocatellia bacterium]|nr:hypothetical protein [Blastocatellia bacterium]
MNDESANKQQGNVIRFKLRDEADPLVQRKPRDYQGCRHKYTEVDGIRRMVYCQDCQVSLDPIQVLLDLCDTYTERDYKYQKITESEEREAAKYTQRQQRQQEKKAKG